ncbi:tetratricopeptide repeat protein [Campylobacter lari]|nr:tetratricopeptide repeat protein [Campylobacter lari]
MELSIDAFKKSIDLDENLQYPCFALAGVLYDLQDYEQALKYYDKTIELYEEYTQTYINRGILKSILKE